MTQKSTKSTLDLMDEWLDERTKGQTQFNT